MVKIVHIVIKFLRYIVGGWPWQMDAIRAVVTTGEPGDFFCQLINAQFHLFPIGHISRNLNTTHL